MDLKYFIINKLETQKLYIKKTHITNSNELFVSLEQSVYIIHALVLMTGTWYKSNNWWTTILTTGPHIYWLPIRIFSEHLWWEVTWRSCKSCTHKKENCTISIHRKDSHSAHCCHFKFISFSTGLNLSFGHRNSRWLLVARSLNNITPTRETNYLAGKCNLHNKIQLTKYLIILILHHFHVARFCFL